MRKTKLHTNQSHGKNHGKTTIKKQTVQQLSENMPPKLNHPNFTKTNPNFTLTSLYSKKTLNA